MPKTYLLLIYIFTAGPFTALPFALLTNPGASNTTSWYGNGTQTGGGLLATTSTHIPKRTAPIFASYAEDTMGPIVMIAEENIRPSRTGTYIKKGGDDRGTQLELAVTN
ncbi:hypothetical protein DL767_009585 [Monosporascus sp. MG133]|nr:hypothetical protein DL767_009585 [Monosporascus sp. MG133]